MSLNGRHTVKIGDSFRKNGKSNLVTFKYDFLPKSLGTNKTGEVILDTGNSITVKFINQSGTASDHTFYKGTYDKATKECVLIVDKNTGQMILEKVDYVVCLKNHRERVNVPANSSLTTKKKPVAEASLSDSSDDDALPDGRKSPSKNYDSKQTAKNSSMNPSHERMFDYDTKMDNGEPEQFPTNHAIDDLHLSDEDDGDSVSGHINMDNAAEQVMQDIQLTDTDSGSSSNSSASSSTSDEE